MPRILLVDDDVSVSLAIARLLTNLGFSVESVHSCAAALRAEGPFEAGVLDIDLPDGSGAELARVLLDGSRIARVVFCTGGASPDAHTAASELGPVILKPDVCEQLPGLLPPRGGGSWL